MPPPLRVLVVVSRPIAAAITLQDGEEKFEAIAPVAVPPVDIVARELHNALADDNPPLQVRFLPWGRLTDFQTALAEGYDIIHFAGHGSEDGRLLFERDDSTADFVDVARLKTALAGYPVRLILISACHSEAPGRAAQEAGIPNVVMVDGRYPMDAQAAAVFNRQFYALLSRGQRPSFAFAKAVDAVRTDPTFGDHTAPPRNDRDEPEPHYSERFRSLFADDRPLVEGVPGGGFQRIPLPEFPCTVEDEPGFIGREHYLVKIIRAIRDGRLITLVGPGGIGKSRIGRQAALWHADRRRFPQGVIEVKAENVKDANELAIQIARALEIKPDPENPWEGLRRNLDGRRLLYLDNADDLHADAARGEESAIGRLGWLIKRCPDLRLLVSSREALVLPGEHVIEVETMDRREAAELFRQHPETGTGAIARPPRWSVGVPSSCRGNLRDSGRLSPGHHRRCASTGATGHRRQGSLAQRVAGCATQQYA